MFWKMTLMVMALPSCYAEILINPQTGFALSPCSRLLAKLSHMSSFACTILSLVVTLVACSCCCVDIDRLESSEESEEGYIQELIN